MHGLRCASFGANCVETVPHRNARLTSLLREGWREGKRTLANRTRWPPAKIKTLRRTLWNETLVDPEDACHSVCSRPYGQVAAGLGSWCALGLDRLLAARPSRQRELTAALVAARMLEPRSQLATAHDL